MRGLGENGTLAVGRKQRREKDEAGNATISQGEWLKQKKKTAEVAKHKTERFVGTESSENDEPSSDVFSCSTCANAKENAEEALAVLDHYGIPRSWVTQFKNG